MYQRVRQKIPTEKPEGTTRATRRYQRGNHKVHKGNQKVPKGATIRYQREIRRYQKG